MEQPLPERDADGVDLTLVEWMLSLTPDERLTVLENYMDDIASIRAENANRQR